MNPLSKGIRTSEFWLSLGAVLVAAIAPMVHQTTAAQALSVVGAVLAALGYTASRGIVKAAAVKAGDDAP